MLKIDPIWQPDIQQTNFRLVLDAMSHPGRCFTLHTLPDEGPVVLSILATLLDAEVSLSDPHDLLRADDWLMLQAKSASTDEADYVLCDAMQLPNLSPKLGTLPNPDQSATLILKVGKLGMGDHKLTLSGPGIKDIEYLSINGLKLDWLSKRDDWNGAFPLGIDIILVDDKSVAALPRTTNVKVEVA